MKIFLIGYMGSGKSTLGPQLASRLNVPFLDLDREVEKSEGKNIVQIFNEQGEDHFRMIEKKNLNQLIKTYPDFVMAAGGGTPCFSNNMDIMKKNGLTIYLSVGVRELVNRNLKSKELRPLLRGMNELEMHTFINDHLKQRLPHYKKASLTVKENDNDLERLMQDIRLMTHSR